ncbi:hypothetical protein Tco_0826879 [Tanacetum coccineum]
MIWRGMSLRYGTGKKKVNEVDFISQGVELGLYDDGEGDCKWTLGGSREKLEWWFEQDIDDEEEEDEEGESGSEVWEFDNLNNGKNNITWESMVIEKDAKNGLAK